MHFVYVLKSLKDNNRYIGYSTNVYKRLKEHNNGKNQSTRDRSPFELIYYEAHRNKIDAIRREKYFKSTKGKSM